MPAFIFFLVPIGGIVFVLLWLLGGFIASGLTIVGLIFYGIGKAYKSFHHPPNPHQQLMDQYKIPDDLRPWMKRVKPDQRRLFR
jgi:hypothetical protein